MDIERHLNRGLNGFSDDPYGLFGEESDLPDKKTSFSEIIRMHNNENIFGVSKRVLQGINEIAPYSNIYPEGSYRILRKKLADRLSVTPENIIITNGGDELIYYSAMSFINDDDEVVLPKITFSVYDIAYKIMRAKIINSKMDGYGIDLNDILKRITDKTKVIVICNPNNPTGHAIENNRFLDFLKRVPSGVIVIVDEAYRDFVAIDDYPDSISLLKEGYKNILILRTFSKSYGIAGLRVGYGIANTQIIASLNKVKLPFNVSIISQFAALAAMDDNEYYKRIVESVKKGREFLYRSLNKLNIPYEKSNTNFILIHTGEKTECIVEKLKNKGILVLNTSGYGLPFSIRVTIATQKQNEFFINALKKAVKEC